MLLVKNFEIFPSFYFWQNQTGKCVGHILERKKAFLDHKKQKVKRVAQSEYFQRV